MAPSNECVRVVVRCRPLNSTERNDNRGVIVEMNKSTGTVILSAGSKASNEPPKTFTFDAVFPPDTHQVWLRSLRERELPRRSSLCRSHTAQPAGW
jgi:kinesin family protein 3/17